jgi:hypothetical protein
MDANFACIEIYLTYECIKLKTEKNCKNKKIKNPSPDLNIRHKMVKKLLLNSLLLEKIFYTLLLPEG